MRRLTEISDLFAAICEPREDFVLTRPFGWMDLDTAPPADPRVAQAGEPDLDQIERLLEQSFPDSRGRGVPRLMLPPRRCQNRSGKSIPGGGGHESGGSRNDCWQ